MKKTLLYLACMAGSITSIAQPGYIQQPTLVKDLLTSTGGNPNIDQQVVMNGKMYFVATGDPSFMQRSLYVTDGTPAGTQLVKSIPGFNGLNPESLSVIGNKLLFTSYDGSTGESNLWVSDGTTSGTQQLIDINPGGDDQVYSLTVINGKAYFPADDGVHGIELWTSDGTATGTVMLKDMAAGASDKLNGLYTAFNNTVYYFAVDDITGGLELWKTDGTTSGTSLVKSFGVVFVDYLQYTMVAGSYMYFTLGEYGNTCELWKTDGTGPGTQYLTDLGDDDIDGDYAVLGNKLILTYPDASGQYLIATDGNQVQPLQAYSTIGSSGNYTQLKTFNGKVYFNGYDSQTGLELWSTDGTPVGTTLVKDIVTGTGNSGVGSFTEYNSRLYFAANDATGSHLYWTDGTSTGTQQLSSPGGAPATTVNVGDKWMVYNDSLYYEAQYTNTTMGTALYKLSLIPTGIHDISADIDLSMYPNPNNGRFNIKSDMALKTIQVLNTNGQIVYTQANNSNGKTISVELPVSLSNGIYIIRVNTDKGTAIRQFSLSR